MINSLRNSARASVFRELMNHVRNSDRDAEALQGLLRGHDLRSELQDGGDAVEEGLGAHLYEARDEFGFGVRLEGCEERIAALFPFIGDVEAELIVLIRGEWRAFVWLTQTVHVRPGWFPNLRLRLIAHLNVILLPSTDIPLLLLVELGGWWRELDALLALLSVRLCFAVAGGGCLCSRPFSNARLAISFEGEQLCL